LESIPAPPGGLKHRMPELFNGCQAEKMRVFRSFALPDVQKTL
jgi:hypothetical protein